MGEGESRGPELAAALRLGIELGMNLVDTAEIYGDGGAEEIVGEAIRDCRDDVFLVSKVAPDNASRRRMTAACERSLKRLGTDRLDLYLLHWRGAVPLVETVEAFEALRAAGKILRWGVSNFDVADLDELSQIASPSPCATNQVLYNLRRRGVEHGVIPWCRAGAMPIMAYSPIEQGRLLTEPALCRLAAARGITPARIALAWLLRQDGVIVIPKAADPEHVRDNRAALDLALSDAETAEFDRAFPRPRHAGRLEMI
jgi:diketogulonate reductase-like aldo/keto reductase